MNDNTKQYYETLLGLSCQVYRVPKGYKGKPVKGLEPLTDIVEIEKALTTWNITVLLNDLSVVGFDEGDEKQILQLAADTMVVHSPSDGYHLYYLNSEHSPSHSQNNVQILGLSADIRVTGGYIMGAGSVYEDKRYDVVVYNYPAKYPQSMSVTTTAAADQWMGEKSFPNRFILNKYLFAMKTGVIGRITKLDPSKDSNNQGLLRELSSIFRFAHEMTDAPLVIKQLENVCFKKGIKREVFQGICDFLQANSGMVKCIILDEEKKEKKLLIPGQKYRNDELQLKGYTQTKINTMVGKGTLIKGRDKKGYWYIEGS